MAKHAKNHEIASNLLHELTKTRDCLLLIRSPSFEYGGTDEQEGLDLGWATLAECLMQFANASVAAIDVWGDDYKQLHDRFFIIAAEYRVATNKYVEIPPNKRADFKWYPIVYGFGDEDELTIDVRAASQAIEDFLRPYILSSE